MGYILLVEDNQDTADMIHRLLTSAGYDVVHFTRGLAGLRAARLNRPELVLMDFNLPDIDGRTIVMMIKKQVRNPPPIIAVTARTGESEQSIAQYFGCDAFVNKPFDPVAFVALVQQFTQQSSTATPTVSAASEAPLTAPATQPAASDTDTLTDTQPGTPVHTQ